jgi:hypothetical protein
MSVSQCDSQLVLQSVSVAVSHRNSVIVVVKVLSGVSDCDSGCQSVIFSSTLSQYDNASVSAIETVIVSQQAVSVSVPSVRPTW